MPVDIAKAFLQADQLQNSRQQRAQRQQLFDDQQTDRRNVLEARRRGGASLGGERGRIFSMDPGTVAQLEQIGINDASKIRNRDERETAAIGSLTSAFGTGLQMVAQGPDEQIGENLAGFLRGPVFRDTLDQADRLGGPRARELVGKLRAAAENPAGMDRNVLNNLMMQYGVEPPRETVDQKVIRGQLVNQVSGVGGSRLLNTDGTPVTQSQFPAQQGIGIQDGQLVNFSSSTGAKIEQRILDNGQVLAELNAMSAAFRPEFQTLGERFDQAVTGMTAFVRGEGAVNPEDRESLEAYTEFRTTAAKNLAGIVNSLAGAAVSESEAARILGFVPDAGTGIFDGDNPIAFRQKLKTFRKLTRAAIARDNWIKTRGLTLSLDEREAALPLGNFEAVIQKRGKEIFDQLRKSNPNASPAAIEEAARSMTAAEFGLN